MLNILRYIALFIFVIAGHAWAEAPPNYPFIAFDEGLKQAKAQNKPIFLYFGRFGCAWCDEVNRKSFSDAALRELYIRDFILVYVDAESGKKLRLPSGERITEANLGVRYKAFGTPMFLYLDQEGKELARIPGIQSVQEFKDYDRYVIEGHYKNQSLAQFLKGIK